MQNIVEQLQGYMWFLAQIINCNISGTIVSNTDESYIGGVSGYTYGGEIQKIVMLICLYSQ